MKKMVSEFSIFICFLFPKLSVDCIMYSPKTKYPLWYLGNGKVNTYSLYQNLREETKSRVLFIAITLDYIKSDLVCLRKSNLSK